jgi:hypothetical protein
MADNIGYLLFVPYVVNYYGPEGHSISNWWVFCVSRFVPEKIKTVAIAVGELKLHTLSVESTVEKV